MLKVLELFSGYGSQALALERLGIEFESCISEIDRYAIQAYNLLHGNTTNYGDIKSIDETSLPYFDLITYSSPCQDFSKAGLQRGGVASSGTRSSLLWECERIIRAVKPKYLLMENVKNLATWKFMGSFYSWLKVLEEIGYQNSWEILNAKDFGVPQNRERLFVVSILGGQRFKFPQGKPLDKTIYDVLDTVVDEKFYLTAEQEQDAVKWHKHRTICPTIRCGGRGTFDRKHSFDIVDVCLNGKRRMRKLTAREIWRLMGVSDSDFDKVNNKLSDTQLCRLAGNSIVVNVLEAIFRSLLL